MSRVVSAESCDSPANSVFPTIPSRTRRGHHLTCDMGFTSLHPLPHHHTNRPRSGYASFRTEYPVSVYLRAIFNSFPTLTLTIDGRVYDSSLLSETVGIVHVLVLVLVHHHRLAIPFSILSVLLHLHLDFSASTPASSWSAGRSATSMSSPPSPSLAVLCSVSPGRKRGGRESEIGRDGCERD